MGRANLAVSSLHRRCYPRRHGTVARCGPRARGLAFQRRSPSLIDEQHENPGRRGRHRRGLRGVPGAAGGGGHGAQHGQLNIVADAYTHSLPTVTVTQSQNWTSAPATLNVSADAVAHGGIYRDHNEVVSAFGTAQATWASANAGAVKFTNYGWNFDVKDPDDSIANGADVDSFNRPGRRQRLDLRVPGRTSNGVFTMDYNVTATGTTLGTASAGRSSSTAPAVGPNLFDPAWLGNDPTTSGRGHGEPGGRPVLYGLARRQPQYRSLLQRGISRAPWTGAFDWNISEGGGVPEPASWALMLVGFGGLGAVLRSAEAPPRALSWPGRAARPGRRAAPIPTGTFAGRWSGRGRCRAGPRRGRRTGSG